MTFQFQSLLKAGDTLSQICGLGEDIVLAIITGVVEPPYRPVGAIMGGSFEWHPKKCFWRCRQTNRLKHQKSWETLVGIENVKRILGFVVTMTSP